MMDGYECVAEVVKVDGDCEYKIVHIFLSFFLLVLSDSPKSLSS